jgi:tetratricopeptide (TPR) repeat protein
MKRVRDIERMIRQLRHPVDARAHDRIVAHLLDALKQRRQQPAAARQPFAGRAMMKSPAVRLAAAAVITIAALLFSFLPRLTSPVYALDQTVEAMKNIRFVHVVRRNKARDIEQERWIEIGPNGRHVRYRHDKSGHLFVIADGESTARYYPNRKLVVFYDPNAMPYQWIGPLGQIFENLRQEGMIIEEDVLFRGRRVHKVWWPMMRDVCYVDPDSKRAIAIGNVELSYEDPPAGTFDIVTPEGYSVVDGPLDLSAHAAERENLFHIDVEILPSTQTAMEVVNRDDVIRLYPIGPYRYDGDLDLNVRCDSEVSWGLSIAADERTVGSTYACRIDKFHLSAPGGVVTAGVTVKYAKLDHLPPGTKLATLRLSPTQRPNPANDARACQKLAFALYDAKRYEEALVAFENVTRAENVDELHRAIALVWQGHVLDLLGRREEAVARYQSVVAMDLKYGVNHDNYGLSYKFTRYARKRIKAPFTRLENQDRH